MEDVDVFLNMKKFGETIELQNAVEKLVKIDLEETSRLMRIFLQEKDGHPFTHKRPVLYQFLKYFSHNTKDRLVKKYIQRILVEFRRKLKQENNTKRKTKLPNFMYCWQK